MATDPTGEYHWRETYFILFESDRRPTAEQMERTLRGVGDRCQISHVMGDDQGRFESITMNSAADHAAVEISYESGETVIEQACELAKQFRSEAEPEQLQQLMKSDARMDVMHFELVNEEGGHGDDLEDDMLDPSCLLTVIDAVVQLTEGVPVDPASGVIMP